MAMFYTYVIATVNCNSLFQLESSGSDGLIGVHGLEAEEERGADGDAGGVGGRGEAAEGERGAVDEGGEGGVVAERRVTNAPTPELLLEVAGRPPFRPRQANYESETAGRVNLLNSLRLCLTFSRNLT